MVVTLIAWGVFAILTGIAILHAYWGFGGLWPATNESDLVKTVIGITRSTQMPPGHMSIAVAALVMVAGGFVLARGVFDLQSILFVRIPLGIIAAVFLARGIYAYLPGPFARATEPFATLNALYFSPLIIVLGLAVAILALVPAKG